MALVTRRGPLLMLLPEFLGALRNHKTAGTRLQPLPAFHMPPMLPACLQSIKSGIPTKERIFSLDPRVLD